MPIETEEIAVRSVAWEVDSRTVRTLIVGRVSVVFLLLLASWWWTTSYLELPATEFPLGLFIVFLVTAVLTVIYLALLHYNVASSLMIRLQLGCDIVLITAIIVESGGVISPYVALYIILISIAGFFLSRNETVLLAVACAAVFSVLAIVLLRVGGSGDVSSPRFLQIVGFNDVALLVVGLLAGRFADRRRVSAELQETVELFADLHILHERMVESMHSGLITTDPDGKIYAFNRAAGEISGLHSETIIGKSVFDLFGAEFATAVERSLSGGKPFEDLETEMLVGDRRILLACTIAPLVGTNGNTTGLILNFLDLTRLRAMEQSLRRADRLAAVGRMAAGLAHELRNPLGSMSSALQFLEQKVPPSTTEAELMKIVLRESDRLNRIITNFLSYARPSANGFQGETMVPTDVGDAIRDCLALLKHSPDINDNHRVVSSIPDGPLIVNGNETQLKQVFWNLTRNAIEAMPDGGELNVSINANGGGSSVRIVFRDSGVGLSEDARKHLFEPFAEGARGTGLGLSIVHRIVTEHGGRIEVESGPNKGSTFAVELPLAAT